MFDGSIYVTSTLKRALPRKLLNVLVRLTKELPDRGIELDYLQVFQLGTDGKGQFQITHTQEVPGYTGVWNVENMEPIHTKVFFIDTENGVATMMLAEEY